MQGIVIIAAFTASSRCVSCYDSCPNLTPTAAGVGAVSGAWPPLTYGMLGLLVCGQSCSLHPCDEEMAPSDLKQPGSRKLPAQ